MRAQCTLRATGLTRTHVSLSCLLGARWRAVSRLTKDEPWSEVLLPPRELLDARLHQGVQHLRVVVELDVDVEDDMAVSFKHEELERLGKGADALGGKLGGCVRVENPQMVSQVLGLAEVAVRRDTH